MNTSLPHHTIPLIRPVAQIDAIEWASLPSLPPLWLADGSGPAVQQTRVRLCHDGSTLHVRFDCDDRDIWGTYTQRDDPIYDEEVVELFIGAGDDDAGSDDPMRYAEFEISPHGVLFDALIHNPAGDRTQMTVDTAWDCPGVRWRVQREAAQARWTALLSVPWATLTNEQPLPTTWRANLYRIERPRDPALGATEFSGWSPTLTDPADFHKPARFGVLHLASHPL